MSDVFIIGAGCSVPYGFPTGRDLMQKLKNFNYKDDGLDSQYFSPPSYLFDLYQEHFGKYQDYVKLRKAGGQYVFRAEAIEVKISTKIKGGIINMCGSI